MFILFFILWVLFAGAVNGTVLATGAVVSALLWLFGYRVLGYRARFERRFFRKLWGAVRYLGYLLVEILKAGFLVMRLIYSPGRAPEPRLIHFASGVRSERARAVLADSITLTAGTITVSAENGDFLVHALDKSMAEGIEDSEFARRLRQWEE